MAPFNNYCIICDKQILPNKNPEFNKLYCSESCQQIDRSFLRSNLKNSSRRKISNVTNINDTIITTPLLLPIWQEQNLSKDIISKNHSEQSYLIALNNSSKNSICHNNDFVIPNFNDSIAENNYRIWLNNI